MVLSAVFSLGSGDHAARLRVMKPLPMLLVAVLVAGALPGEEPPPMPDDKVVVLEAMKIVGTPIISFAIDIRIYQDPDTKKVDRIFITKVYPRTDAEAAELQVGDEILRINGVPVKDYEAIVSVKSPLGKLLLNRFPGSPIRLDVLTRKTEKVTLRAQRPTLNDRLR